jgi:RNA polymerase sigma-70 factor (ECF subfamily)
MMGLYALAWFADARPFAVLAVTVQGGRVVAIDVRAEPARLGRLDLTAAAG